MNIYAYGRPEIYLKDKLQEKKGKNPQFSLRAWARLLGMKTHTPLQLMLASKRPIPKKYIPLFGKSLELSASELEYLEVMIDLQRAKKNEDKEHFFQKMQKLRASHQSDDEMSHAAPRIPEKPISNEIELGSL